MAGYLTRLSARALSSVLDKTVVFSFNRTGYRRHRQSFRETDLDVDLAGKLCLVTGANSGLGRATAFALARRGAEVWLLCRNEERGRRALDGPAAGDRHSSQRAVRIWSRATRFEATRSWRPATKARASYLDPGKRY